MDRRLEILLRLRNAKDFLPLTYEVDEYGKDRYHHTFTDANGMYVEVSGIWEHEHDPLNNLLAHAPADLEYVLREHNHLVAEREWAQQQANDYHTALTRILKWATEHTHSNWSEAGDAEAYANGPAEELIDALSDAGFEIDQDDCLVIHGERVEG